MNEVKHSTFEPTDIASAPAVVAYLKSLWQELLRVPEINPEENFFVLGGDSVLVIEMLVAVSAHYDREFEYNKFFSRPTIGTLSALVVETLKTDHE